MKTKLINKLLLATLAWGLVACGGPVAVFQPTSVPRAEKLQETGQGDYLVPDVVQGVPPYAGGDTSSLTIDGIPDDLAGSYESSELNFKLDLINKTTDCSDDDIACVQIVPNKHHAIIQDLNEIVHQDVSKKCILRAHQRERFLFTNGTSAAGSIYFSQFVGNKIGGEGCDNVEKASELLQKATKFTISNKELLIGLKDSSALRLKRVAFPKGEPLPW